MNQLQIFLPCAAGVEDVLAHEVHDLTGLMGEDLLTRRGGVMARASWRDAMRLNLHSRLTQRVLIQLSQTFYRNEKDLYDAASAVAWEIWFTTKQTFKIEITAQHSPLTSLNFAALKIKDAVADRFRAKRGERPDVNTQWPDVRIYAHLTPETLTLYIDTSGEPLFKRGWRTDKGDAHGGRPIIGDIVKERTETTQHFLVEILVIAFLAVAEVQEGAKAGRGGRIGCDLGVDLGRALRTKALPLVGTDVRAADVGRHTAEITGVERAVNAERIAVAIGGVAGNAEFLLGRAAEEFDGAAQVGGGGGAERAGALADAGGADIVGDDGAADVKAVGVAIAHVAQRHAIQREAELVLVEATNRDAR